MAVVNNTIHQKTYLCVWLSTAQENCRQSYAFFLKKLYPQLFTLLSSHNSPSRWIFHKSKPNSTENHVDSNGLHQCGWLRTPCSKDQAIRSSSKQTPPSSSNWKDMEQLFKMYKFHSQNRLGKYINGILLCESLITQYLLHQESPEQSETWRQCVSSLYDTPNSSSNK